MIRARMRSVAGRAQFSAGRLAQRILDALPFALTGAQAQAVGEIRADLAQPEADDPPAAGRRRLGQDDRRAAGDGRRRRSGTSGGADGADRNPRPPAFRAHPPARRGRRPAHCADHRPRQGVRAPPDACRARSGRDRHRRRHPRFVPGERRLPRSRSGGGRRAAPLRRPPAPRARRQGRGGRSVGDDRDADPAHAGARLFRRHGRLCADREAARPPADRHPRVADRTARRGRRGRSAARSPTARAPIGSVRWSRRARRSTSPRRRSATKTCGKCSATRSASSTAG